MARFTTVLDVVNELKTVEPEFAKLLSDDELADVARAAHWSRYEEIDDDEFDAILTAAYEASGASEDDARRMVYGNAF